MKERTMLRTAPLFAFVSVVGAGLALFTLLGRTASTDGNVRALTDGDFDTVVDGSIPALVEFYAPWCGHCKKLAPVYEQLGDAFAHAKESVLIAKVNADEHNALRTRFGITGYPTLKWFPKGVTGEPENYRGGRELQALIDFVESSTGIRAAKPQEPKTAVTVLRSSNFDKIVLDDSKDVLVEFYAPCNIVGCKFCKELAPVYNKVAMAFENEPNCVVANLDITESKDIAEKYNIEAYPTIKFFPKGDKGNPVEHSGRDEKDFVNFLNERCGTHRTPGGGLLTSAGRLDAFDSIAREFAEAVNNEQREAFYNQAKELAEGWVLSASSGERLGQAPRLSDEDAAAGKISQMEDDAARLLQRGRDAVKGAVSGSIDDAKQAIDATKVKHAQYYVRVMEKIKEQKDYVEKELARLRKVATSGQVPPQKLDDFLTRQNILSAFRKITGGAPELANRHQEL